MRINSHLQQKNKLNLAPLHPGPAKWSPPEIDIEGNHIEIYEPQITPGASHLASTPAKWVGCQIFSIH